MVQEYESGWPRGKYMIVGVSIKQGLRDCTLAPDSKIGLSIKGE